MARRLLISAAMPEPAAPPAPVVVLGVGNPLCADDGAGGRVIQALSQQHSASARADWIDGGTLGLVLLERLEARAGLIVVDASRMGLEPGAVRVYEGAGMDAHLSRTPKSSAHELGISELLGAAALTFGLPERRALVAVEPECVSLGMALTARVEAAIPLACQAVLALLTRWEAA